MSRISTLNVGIEGFTHVSLEQVENGFHSVFSCCLMVKPLRLT